MKKIDEDFFCREIKKAHIICSSDYGYIVSLFNNNPYKYTDFHPPANSQFYYYAKEWGYVLKLVHSNNTKLIAICIQGEIKGGYDVEDDEFSENQKRGLQIL